LLVVVMLVIIVAMKLVMIMVVVFGGDTSGGDGGDIGGGGGGRFVVGGGDIGGGVLPSKIPGLLMRRPCNSSSSNTFATALQQDDASRCGAGTDKKKIKSKLAEIDGKPLFDACERVPSCRFGFSAHFIETEASPIERCPSLWRMSSR
jgi:hypothetical protein